MRLYVPLALAEGAEFALPAGAARHAQVRRVQPGDTVVLFDGSCSDWRAEVLAVGRSAVQVRVGAPVDAAGRELAQRVRLALAMPANERMDALVEKATELGAAAIQPLTSERSVLRLEGDRAERKRAHWQAVSVAACEQCGRARVPEVAPVLPLAAWLAALPPRGEREQRLLLSLAPDAPPLRNSEARCAQEGEVTLLSGAEGGLTADEESAARRCGFEPVALGTRVLRADTAPLAALAWIALQAQPRA